MTLARRTVGNAPDPHGRALAGDDGGWDPYEVWYTRVLLPRRRAELAAADPPPIAAVFRAGEAPAAAADITTLACARVRR